MTVSVLTRFYTLDDGFFSLNLRYLFLVGLWPEDDLTVNQRFLYNIYENIIHVLSVLFLIITGIGTYRNRNDLTFFLTNLDKVLVGYHFFFKTIFFLLKRNKLRDLIIEIENSGDLITEERKKLMAKSTIVISTLSFLIVSAFSLLAIYEGEMTIEAWMPFDPLESRMNLITSAQILAFVFLPLMFRGFAMQGIVCSLLMYMCDQLIELQNTIRGISYTNDTGAEARIRFKNAINKHVRLIRYSKSMKIIFNEFFLIQNLAITVELCLTAIMVTVISDIKLLLNFAAYLGIAVLNAYIYSYLGNELIIQSQGLALAGYESPWTSWPVDMQKDLLILIRAAQRPLALSAGGMATLCIETFSQALYNGYSIFAVLNDMVD